jgi:hypothetical protein
MWGRGHKRGLHLTRDRPQTRLAGSRENAPANDARAFAFAAGNSRQVDLGRSDAAEDLNTTNSDSIVIRLALKRPPCSGGAFVFRLFPFTGKTGPVAKLPQEPTFVRHG